MTFRLFGLFLVSFALLMVVPMIMGYEHHKVITLIFAILFGEDDMLVKHRWGKTTYRYEDFTDLSQVSPDNSSFYNIINIRVGRESFIIPFTMKQEFCDKVYTYVNERMTVKMLEDDLLKKDTDQ